MDYYFANPNIRYPNYPNSAVNMLPESYEFVLSDYLMLDDGGCDHHHQESWSQSTESSEKAASEATGTFHGATATSENDNLMQVIFLSLVSFFSFIANNKVVLYMHKSLVLVFPKEHICVFCL
ncbi:hypothetical protein L6164_025077 [Bauhinia variegata]|uniref:Uncharacterized protein n=1 Tax=Bauhinia variegata TaxID=167791 RepID=A0ACB9M0G4_BAUVA|nr:hypothetical protein L6164_025077 [Bauhinia variegata]